MTQAQLADPAALAEYLWEKSAEGAQRIIVGIVGTPGTGKSTFAEQLHEQFAPGTSVIVPMDGFHLANGIIDDTPLRQRKGAIDTMDGGGYVALLHRLRLRDEPVVYAPSYRRGLEEPIAASIPVPASAAIVLTEGNYLLADVSPWDRVRGYLDEAWYVEVPRELRMKRLIQRHIKYGMSAEMALRWASGPDEDNAVLVESTRARADRFITWS
jgi:pantothenate kinase